MVKIIVSWVIEGVLLGFTLVSSMKYEVWQWNIIVDMGNCLGFFFTNFGKMWRPMTLIFRSSSGQGQISQIPYMVSSMKSVSEIT